MQQSQDSQVLLNYNAINAGRGFTSTKVRCLLPEWKNHFTHTARLHVCYICTLTGVRGGEEEKRAIGRGEYCCLRLDSSAHHPKCDLYDRLA